MNEPRPDQPRETVASFDVVRLGGRRRRVDPGLVLVGLAVVLVLAAIVQPWQSSGGPRTALAQPPALAPAPSSRPAAASSAAPSASPPGALPSASDPAQQFGLVPVMRDLAGYSGRWGVGVGARTGSGSLTASGGWSAWVGIRPSTFRTPHPASSKPPVVKATALCVGVPGLPSGAQVVAITAPAGPLANFQVAGWRDAGWRDDPSGITAVTEIRQMTPYQTGDVTYLQLPNGKAWPDGRYLFQIGGAANATTLTVCLGQP